MIGRLLQTAGLNFSPHNPSRPQTPLESVTEEAHTRDLLFPDISLLRACQQSGLPFPGARELITAKDATNFDDRGGLDVSYPGDIRVLIAQDANARYHQPQVLYDSRPSLSSPFRAGSPTLGSEPASTQSLLARGKSTNSPNLQSEDRLTPHGSVFVSPRTNPPSPTTPKSPETRLRSRGKDSASRQLHFGWGEDDVDIFPGRNAMETKEETEALLGCMFGAPGFRLKAGTKVHVIPKKTSDTISKSGSKHAEVRPPSSGGFTRQRTPLVRSTSAADMTSYSSSSTDDKDQYASNSRPSIMLTRLFHVNLPEPSSLVVENSPSIATELGDHPIPKSTPTSGGSKEAREKTVKPSRAPIYAIALILRSPSEVHNWRLQNLAPQAGPSSLSSSFNDFLKETPPNASPNTSETRLIGIHDAILNPQISQVLAHWKIINGALETLEFNIREKLLQLLEQSPPLAPLTSIAFTQEGGPKAKASKPPTQQSIYIASRCLQDDELTNRVVEATSQRLVSSLKTRRVVTSQGRWGAWREEARWISKWASSRDQNPFFCVCLTAFLGCHTSWLQSMVPSWYRRRLALRQRVRPVDSTGVKKRTIVVTSDKMAARRLIFLLAEFLPNSALATLKHLQKSPSVDFPVAESPPPAFFTRSVPTRRTASRKPDQARKSMLDHSGHTRSVSFSLMEETHEVLGSGSPTRRHLSRRGSDARSAKSSSVSIPSRSQEPRKTSTSTLVADSTVPVPHFANLAGSVGKDSDYSPESENSLASVALSQNLRRSESTTGGSSGLGAKWGNVVSGFWSSRGGSSTDGSDVTALSRGSPTHKRVPSKTWRPESGKLSRMVEEAALVDRSDRISSAGRDPNATESPESSSGPRGILVHPLGKSSAQSVPHRQKVERMPLKVSVNEDDGFIDVAVAPNASLNSSLASSFASFHLPSSLSGTNPEHYSPYGSCISDSPRRRPGPNYNVAGWLKAYNPDFTLQAVRRYESLIKEVKASMQSEAQLIPFDHQDSDKVQLGWTDVCTSLVLDATRFSVERLRLQRRKKEHSSFAPEVSVVPPYDEQIITEPVVQADETLANALDRTFTQRVRSSAPSRASSPHRPAQTTALKRSASVIGTEPSLIPDIMGVDMEARHVECKQIVLSALEEVIQNVLKEREMEPRKERTHASPKRDNMLREGISEWLGDLEDAW